jgi:hypothetical protein
MDPFGVHSGDRQEKLQLGSDIIKKIEHLYKTGSFTEGRRGTKFLHGLVPTRCHVRKECLHQHESKLACCGAPGPHLLQHIMGEQVQNVLCTHLR